MSKALKAHLKAMPKPHLEKLVMELYARHTSPKEYLDLLANPAVGAAVLEQYLKKMERCFPDLPKDNDLKGARKLLQDFKKLGASAEDRALLQMKHALLGAKYAHDFGDMDARYYITFADSFEVALELAHEAGVLGRFRFFADQVYSHAYHCGWGFDADIAFIYAEFYIQPPPVPARDTRPAALRKTLRKKETASAPVPFAMQEQAVSPSHPDAPANPLGATHPRQYICVDARTYHTDDGPSYVFAVMDAFSNYALHVMVSRTRGLPDYIRCLNGIDPTVCPLDEAVTIVCDAPKLLQRPLMASYPRVKNVVCDPAQAASITDDFHQSFQSAHGWPLAEQKS